MKNNILDLINKGKSGQTLTVAECRELAAVMNVSPLMQEVVNSSPNFKDQMDALRALDSDEDFLNKFSKGIESSIKYGKRAEFSKQVEGYEMKSPESQNTFGHKKFEPYVPEAFPKDDLLTDVEIKQIFSAETSDWAPKTMKKKKVRYDEVEVSRTYTPQAFSCESPAVTPSDNEDFDNVRESIKIIRTLENTNVFAIAVAKNPDENVITAIRCYGGTSFGGYAHDLSRDAYLVQCVECLQVGQLPFSFAVTMLGVGEWQVKVPIPENVLEKHFNPRQRRLLDDYKQRYPEPDYCIQFIQMQGCN